MILQQKANLIYMSHTQDPEHSWRMYELSKGRKLHLGHANAAGTGSHGNAEEAMQSVIELCKKKNITAEICDNDASEKRWKQRRATHV